MLKTKVKPIVVNPKLKRKNNTVPRQGLNVNELMEKFVKGIPVNARVDRGVFVDQTEFDLEKIGSADRVEKAFEANAWREQAKQLKQEVKQNEQAMKERVKQAEQNAEAKAKLEPAPKEPKA